MTAYVEDSMDGTRQTSECRGIAEQGGDEGDTTGIYDVGVLGELRLPAIKEGVLPKLASLASKSGGKGATVVLELVRVVRVLCDVVAH